MTDPHLNPDPHPDSNPDPRDAEANAWYEHKSALMADMLGTEHDRVMHAIIPFAIGGGLDLYYYTGSTGGTTIATKELSEAPGVGPSNRVFNSYELVMRTRHPLDLDAALDPRTPFGRAHEGINAILNGIAQYSLAATLNPMETCEFPRGFAELSRRCVIFDAADQRPDGRGGVFGLLLVVEVFRSEMKHARKKGTPALIERLNSAGCYPYSDMDRKPVV